MSDITSNTPHSSQGGMRCRCVCLSMAVMVLMSTAEVHGFEHLKYKFKLKKLAKLAFAAKMFAPHFIPLPIPLPIIKRNRHEQTFKVIEDSDPWRAQGWHMAEGWDHNAGQGGWNFDGGSGWQQMQGWHGQMALPESLSSQRGSDGDLQQSTYHQHGVPSLGGGEFGSGGQHSHQVEIREEILPALKAAGFFGDPNGIMMKLHHGANPEGTISWDSTPQSERSKVEGRSHGRARAANEWSTSQQSQLAEVLKVNEIKDAQVVHTPPFDVQDSKLGQFDEPVSNRGQSAAGHGSGLEDLVPEDKLIIREERHQAQGSQSHADISPDVPLSLSLHQFRNQQGWLPMVTPTGQEPPPAERDAHKRS